MPQGTIKDFEEDTRAGSLLMENKDEVSIDATSLEGSGIRTLRLGQRVKFGIIEESGRKIARDLRIVTFE